MPAMGIIGLRRETVPLWRMAMDIGSRGWCRDVVMELSLSVLLRGGQCRSVA